ncbi:hypothetical protein TRV_01728 [Trichophyton verrucosum HKI 0517]|uniref:ATP-dependent RNA helicase n=1 Tax=Trichophyton verrucosum (strain HKI 0517) TaxID=663202 RepID=D4D3R6_TRIVH|nr:uncharacterized protein TRV_01728 [Trichophyton verrucosum HKI 0517]EFE43517.1 hypothetical protein TRV_01728 [Trichophyton verrucosum HKI 0517]
MGALHDGHMSLIRQAAQENTDVVVSIYVNPTQFGVNEDLDSYPRTWNEDLEKIQALNTEFESKSSPGSGRVTAIFAPTTKVVYPTLPPTSELNGNGSFVTITPLATKLEGASRPVFFRGVATVCTKLFNMVTPDRVYFGQKDVQQSIIIKRMVQDFHIDTEVRVGPTSREPDGLAMSSRNAYLGARRRNVGLVLSRAMRAAEAVYLSGKKSRNEILGAANSFAQSTLAEQELLPAYKRARFEVDYISLADPESLEELDHVDESKGAVLSGAVKMFPLEESQEGEDCGLGGGKVPIMGPPYILWSCGYTAIYSYNSERERELGFYYQNGQATFFFPPSAAKLKTSIFTLQLQRRREQKREINETIPKCSALTLVIIMADDGMLMNFDVGDGIISSQQKFKGGKWKDRLVAKKIADHRHKKSKQPFTADDSRRGERGGEADHGGVSSRPPKRQRLNNGDFQPSTATITGVSNNSSSKYATGPQREVISSLFSYNPVAKTVPTVEESTAHDDAEATKASNAPLVDGIDTFTSLGLSPELAAHLLTKLKLKNPTAIQKSSITQLLKENCDGFIQAETGSGKTLAYLLPLVQRLMNLSGRKSAEEGQGQATPIHRDSGLFAIILAPTRELCKQISVVLDSLLNCAHWLVAGTVIGGEKKKSEKARLRKGLNILVATPGRLADHLDNTKVLDVGLVRWLVLDEGDRLMELGFEEEIQNTIKKLDSKRRPTSKIENLPPRRLTVLCSATLKMNVQRLGEMSLKDAVHIQADPADEIEDTSSQAGDAQKSLEFSAPAQLKQSFAIVASKLRLVTLTALLKSTFIRKGTVMKAIVFVSCADSVDYHFEVFTRKSDKSTESVGKGEKEKQEEEKEEKDSSAEAAYTTNSATQGTVSESPTLSNPNNSVILHKLHGSLPQHVRTATLSAFAKQKDTSVLICTDVASRGLDLPNVDFVIEYDPAFSADDHLHRIGRTARLGRDGRAMIFLLPGSEEGYINVLKRGYRDNNTKAVTRSDESDILKRGFGRTNGKGWEEAATEFQLDIERWTLDNPSILEMARRAFQSHIRAYATHIASEREYFNIKDLHLGHLAKGFGLRDRPTKINVPGLRTGKEETKKAFKANRTVDSSDKKNDSGPKNDSAADKMRKKMREHMAAANEFNIA